MTSRNTSVIFPFASWAGDLSNSNFLKQSYINGFLDISSEAIFRSDASMCGNVGINGTVFVSNNMGMSGVINQLIAQPLVGGYVVNEVYSEDTLAAIIGLNKLNNYIMLKTGTDALPYGNPITGNLLTLGSDTCNTALTGMSNYIAGNLIIIKDLSVNGTMQINNDITVNGLKVGAGAQSYLTNTAIGAGNVLKNISSGVFNNNTGVGYNALQNASQPVNNTAIGSLALSVNINGINNTAIGYNSGQLDNYGSYNTYLGSFTGTNNGGLTYNNSTAIGYGATITASNQIILGTITETAIHPGNVSIGSNSLPIYTLDVSGTTRISKDAYINGNINVGGIIIAEGDASFNSRLYVDGDVSFNNRISVLLDVSIGGRLFTSGTAFINGDVSLNSQLFVNGDASFNSRLIIGGDASLNSRLIIDGDASFNSRLFVNGDASFDSRLFVNGDASFNSRLIIGGDASLNSRLIIGGDASLNSQLIIGGDASFNSRLFVNGDATFNSRLILNSDASFNSRLIIGGDASFNSNLYVIGDTNVNGSAFVSSDLSMSGRLFVKGDTELSGNLLIKGALTVQQLQNKDIINTTTSNYQLIVSEDLSLNGRLFVSGDVSMNSRLAISQDVSANATVSVGGDLSLNGRLFVKGNAVFQSAPVMSGANITSSSIPLASIQGSFMDVDAIQTIGGTKTFSNILKANSGILSLTDVSVNSRVIVGRDLSMGGRLFVKGDTELNGEVNIRNVLNPANLVDGSILLSTSLPLEYSSIVSNRISNNPTTTTSWMSSALSYNGQYQTVVGLQTTIYTSSDFGVTFTSRNSAYGWQSVAMSSTGQYQTAVLNDGTQGIFWSIDFGVNWNFGFGAATSASWQSVAMSANGKYQTAVANNRQIYISTNYYGSYWEPVDSSRAWQSVAMSATGQYQTAVVNGGQIYTSNNYGSTWTARDSNRAWQTVSMSATGQYQAAYSTGAKPYISSDYGITWAIVTTGANGSVTVISSGQYQLLCDSSTYFYLSNDFGKTFSQNISYPFGAITVKNIAISGNGQFAIISTSSTYFYTTITPYANAIFNNSLKVVGSVTVTGAISKGSGTFDIEHPLDSSKRLVHSFIEGPRCDLIYRGVIKLKSGKAVVNIDKDCVIDSDCEMSQGTFVALSTNPVCYLQNNQSFDRIIGKIEGNLLTIICENENSEDEINWMVIAERKDNIIKTWDRTNENGYLKTEYNTEK